MARVSTLKRVQVLPIPIREAWDFHSDPRNLAEITPPAMEFRLVSAPPPRISAGLILSYSVKPLPFYRTTWVSEITEVHDLERFVDVQRSGPYRMWRHTHTFRATPTGTIVQDIIEYELPFGALGSLVAGAYVRRTLERLFDFRATALGRRFGSV
jgi:ligand-binding SRPBCC domain-containing protein